MTTEARPRAGLQRCPHCGSRAVASRYGEESCAVCGWDGFTRDPTPEESEGIAEVNRIESTIPGLGAKGGRYWQ